MYFTCNDSFVDGNTTIDAYDSIQSFMLFCTEVRAQKWTINIVAINVVL